MLVSKEKGKRRKLYKDKFYRDFNYYDFKSVVIDGLKGVMYALDNPNIEKLLSVEREYENTKIIKTYCEYAPEIKKVWLFIAR